MSDPASTDQSALRAPQLPTYLFGSATWFMAFGIQAVLFTYITTNVLNLPGSWLGVAQASSTLPALFLLLFGGAVADQIDTRRLMLISHLAATVPPLLLAFMVASDMLSIEVVLVCGVIMGIVTSFMMPAREAMLARVIGPPEPNAIQRAVRFSLLAQFGAQMVGMAFARVAHTVGLVPVLCAQAAIQVVGAILTYRLHPAPPVHQDKTVGVKGQLTRIGEGLSDVIQSPSLLPVTIMTFAIGMLFVGSFMVLLPVILREEFGATVERISTLQICFWGGTITSTLVLGAAGAIARKGRAIMLAVTSGCIVLSLMSLTMPLWVFYALTFAWGMGAGVTITMTRTIIQEDAPLASRARIMSVYQLGFTGGMPLGSLLIGPIVEQTGGRMATPIAASAMMCVLVGVAALTKLWSLEHNAATSPTP